MKRSRRTTTSAVTALAAVAVLTACTSSTGAPATTTTIAPATTTTIAPATTTAGGPTSTTIADVSAIALTVADVGTGWQVGPPINEADLADATGVPCQDTSLNPAITARLRPIGGIQFEPVDHSMRHLIEFVTRGSADRLGLDLGSYIEAIDACAATLSAAPTTSASGITAIERITLPALGDQRAAYSMRATEAAGDAAVWFVRTAIVRVGGTAIDIGLTEILTTAGATPTIDEAGFVAIVEAAVAHLTTT